VAVSDGISAVVGCGSESCAQYVTRGEELGRIVDKVVLADCEVWQIEWADGSVYLMSTIELAGVKSHRPPNRPPMPHTGP
jgi:hypothetical protein